MTETMNESGMNAAQVKFRQVADENADEYLRNKATGAIQEAAVLYGELKAWQAAAKEYSEAITRSVTVVADLETEIKRLRRRLGPDPKRGRPAAKKPTNSDGDNVATEKALQEHLAKELPTDNPNPNMKTNGEDGQTSDPVSDAPAG